MLVSLFNIFPSLQYFSKWHFHSLSCSRQKLPDHPQSCPAWDTLLPSPSHSMRVFDTDLCSCLQPPPNCIMSPWPGSSFCAGLAHGLATTYDLRILKQISQPGYTTPAGLLRHSARVWVPRSPADLEHSAARLLTATSHSSCGTVVFPPLRGATWPLLTRLLNEENSQSISPALLQWWTKYGLFLDN